MKKKMYIFLLCLLVLSTDVVLGNGSNKTKPNKTNKQNEVKISSKNDRVKRSPIDDNEHPFWPHRGKNEMKKYFDIEKEPFWATRGRRESSSIENYVDFPPCDNCYPTNSYPDIIFGNVKHIREDIKSPFWGNRGRRSEEEDYVDIDGNHFWGSRGRRQENDPFWGNRGRRHEDSPFWAQRGRREEDPFWGNRGRRHEDPFWNYRGTRENGEPFWGNRGRREDTEPFWGNRGRREETEPFWGNRDRKKETDPFWSSRGRRKQDIKESLMNAINYVEDDIENMSRMRRSNEEAKTFWQGRSKDAQSKQPNIQEKPKLMQKNSKLPFLPSAKNPDPGTVLDNRMYADEPGYIIVERNSRSSAEDDPFFISRGKKYYVNYDLEKAVRDRRGAIEEIVKSVRNDPFYIARGKKDDVTRNGNETLTGDRLIKVRELICASINLVMKSGRVKAKRDLSDTERDRRTTLRKLAAQLQMDPYFVSRGKKSDAFTHDESMEDFITVIASKCN